MPEPVTDSPAHDERLWPPAWMWVVAVTVAASLGFAFWVPYGLDVGLPVGLAAVAATIGGLVAAGGRVRLADGVLHAGPASLPVGVVGTVSVLDGAAVRDLVGAAADARAYLYLRGWVRTGVRVDLDDPQDVVPYWYVSTRHPDALAAALTAARAAARGTG